MSIAQQGCIPELRGSSQEKHAPPIAPLTLPKNRAVYLVQPAYNAFVEVPERPAPLPSKYVKSEAETHPKDLPPDHPRRIQYLAKVKETRRRRQQERRQAAREAREAMLRPTGLEDCR